jgi:hypothetical protein
MTPLFSHLWRSSFLNLAALLLPLGAMAAPAPGSWVKVDTSKSAQYEVAFYVDSGAIQYQQGARQFRVYVGQTNGRAVYQDDKVTVQGALFYLSTNCRKRNIQLIDMDWLDAQGKIISTPQSKDLPVFEPVAARGWAVGAINYVCSRR